VVVAHCTVHGFGCGSGPGLQPLHPSHLSGFHHPDGGPDHPGP